MEVAQMPNHELSRAVRYKVRNRILLSLPELEFQSILPHLAFVKLRMGQVLYDGDNWIDYAYFMNSGMASLVAVSGDGDTIEDGTVGNKGVMGIQAALGEGRVFCRGVVQIPGTAMRIRSDALRYECEHNAELSKLLQHHMLDLNLQVGQSADCNRLHSLEQRLCRSLLTIQDCVSSDRFTVTHKFLSHMVGASLTPVTVTAELLQEAGLISYQRRYTRIIDRKGIEARTCECSGSWRRDGSDCFAA
jgi:CRP-like cAMP-binding protein